MNLNRPLLLLLCLGHSFTTTAAESLPTKTNSAAHQPVAAELQNLQGTWEGEAVGQETDGKITIQITGNSFHFHRDTNFWFDTTIALPPGKNPKQLHATIKGCPPSQASSIGKVVGAIFKIDDGTMTLVTSGGGAEDTPKSFEPSDDGKGLTRYQLRKVQPQTKKSQPSKTQ